MSDTLVKTEKTEFKHMIKFEQIDKKDKYSWNVFLYNKEKDVSTPIFELKLHPSSLTNKFQSVADFFEDISNSVPKFVVWYSHLLKAYIKSQYNSEVILNETKNFIEYAEKYVNSKNIDFNSFVNYKKVSKTSIVFDGDDIRELHIASTCLKLCSIFNYDNTLKMHDNAAKLVYSDFIKRCCDIGTTEKVYQMIRSKTYRSTTTDKYMWEVIKLGVIETPQSYTLAMFNFIMNNLLSTLDVNSNPVPFLVGVMTDSLRWMMVNIYKDRIIYSEMSGSSSDIYGTSLSKESLNIYCCNDVIETAAKTGLEILLQEYQVTDEQFLDTRDKLNKINRLSTCMKCVTLPIASKVLEIPYTYLLAASPKHIMSIGILLHHCAKDVMDIKFPVLSEFLIACPNTIDTDIVKSSYRIRDIETIINDNENKIFGLNSITIRMKIASSICGILTAAKKDLCSIVTGKRIPKINFSDLEEDVISFYSELYANKLDPMFDKMKEKVEVYF